MIHIGARWHLLAHTSELAAPGDFVVLDVCPKSQVALVHMDNQVIAFDNRCPHRGARIYNEPRGNRPPKCGYHGRCASATTMRTYKTTRVGDFIFACIEPVPPSDRELRDTAAASLLASAPKLAFHSEVRHVYNHHWTVAVENALDNEHVEQVHQNSLAALDLKRVAYVADADGSSIEMFEAGALDRTSNARERLDRVGRIFNSRQTFDYAHAHLFPYAAIGTTRGWTYSLQNYFPRQDGRTNFVSRLYVQADKSGQATARGHFYSTVAAMNARVFAEDEAICNTVEPYFYGHLGPLDDRIRHFRAAGSRTLSA